MVEVSANDAPRFATHGKVVILRQKLAKLGIGVSVATGKLDNVRVWLEAVFRRCEVDGRRLALDFVAWGGFNNDDSVDALDDLAISG